MGFQKIIGFFRVTVAPYIPDDRRNIDRQGAVFLAPQGDYFIKIHKIFSLFSPKYANVNSFIDSFILHRNVE
jgi:hypothetical protein